MKNFFQINGPVFRVGERIWNLLVLNLCMLVTSVPLITIGVSLTASYSVCFKLIEKNDTRIIKNYFHTFRMNFKQSFAFSFILFVLLFIIGADFTYFFKFEKKLTWEFFGVTIVALLILISYQFIFSYIARYEDRFMVVCINSFKLFLSHLGIGLLLIALDIFVVVILTASPQLFIFTIYISAFIGISFITFLKSFLVLTVYKKQEQQSEKLN